MPTAKRKNPSPAVAPAQPAKQPFRAVGVGVDLVNRVEALESEIKTMHQLLKSKGIIEG